mmetsp:Transcript_17463/g.22242  ORF Transcript_17463/g.22242 Transcript_17463/m.22242 type:complete len:170 (-) Transcript_17463:191-700(-)|eukprot:CAMPEP_0204865940 /NCGR_PEP_ID=MMETSP1348-20121228/15042_1 /ASSEMBLY_ACC=CAM_ASM_000700 /TAXON_ID=215587 /ORGANISM="Aplanochytrium stocchinoi, Strain GSBS06" /LENGTH=169 /DNA_ID=CAMNT_0052017583 /DNA_START=50 /DNA_END=559 /DNA_ORIENTATION=-
MATQGGIGELDKQLQGKLDAKYSYEAEAKCKEWIETLTGEKCPAGEQQFGPWLQDGVVLCKLVNSIKEKSGETQGDGRLAKIAKIHDVQGKDDSPFNKSKKMDNITAFIKAVRSSGVMEQANFATVSLLEQKNLGQVVTAITAYSNALKDMDLFEGPYIAPVKEIETTY